MRDVSQTPHVYLECRRTPGDGNGLKIFLVGKQSIYGRIKPKRDISYVRVGAHGSGGVEENEGDANFF